MPPKQRVVGRVSVRVSPDTTKFRADLTKSLERLERTLSVSLPVKTDLQQAQRQAAEAKRVIERELSDVATTLDIGPNQGDLRTTDRQLDALARDRTATVNVDVDRSGIQRAQQALSRLASSLTRIGGRGLGLAGAIGGIATLGGAAAVAAGQIVQLGAALAPAAGALTALPAVAAAAGAALGTLAVATSGVGEAMGTALTGDAEELAEALEGLAPAAQEAVRAVRELRPQFEDLRSSVQQAFFEPFADQVEELGNELLPVLTDGMTQVSSAMGDAAARVVEFAGSANSLVFLEGLFNVTADAVNRAQEALPNLLNGFTELGIVGLPYVSQLGDAVNDLAIRFNDWATEAARSGEAVGWIEGAIDVFKQLGDIASNVGGIIGSVFSAAGSGGLLSTIEQLTGALDDFFASAEGQEALQGVFEGLSSLGSALAPVITSLATGIGALAPIVGRLAEAFGPILTTAIDALVPALTELEPGLMAIMDGLMEGVSALVDTGALTAIGTAFSEILTALAPLLPALGELAGTILIMLADVLVAIAPSLAMLAQEIADNLVPHLPELSAAFSELIAAVAPLLPQLIDALLPVLEILPPLMLMLAEQTQGWAQFIRRLTPWIETLIGFVGWLVSAAANLVKWVLNVVGSLWRWSQSAKDAGRTIRSAIGGMVDRVVGFLVGLVNRGRRLFRTLVGAGQALFGSLRDRVVGAARSLRDGVVNSVNRAANFVANLPGRIMGFLSGSRRYLKNAGLNLIYGLIDGINDAVSYLWDRMSGIAQTVRDYWPFSPAKTGPLRSHPMDKAGRNIGEMLAEGIRESEDIVARASAGVAAAAARPTSALSDVEAPDEDAEGGRAVVQVTNNYPQAEPTSTTVNRGLQYASAIGVV